jgi:hypothetical protein
MVNQWIDQWILESTTCCAERAENTTTSRRLLAKAPPTGSPLADREAAIAGDCASDLPIGSPTLPTGRAAPGSSSYRPRPSVRRSLRYTWRREDKKQKTTTLSGWQCETTTHEATRYCGLRNCLGEGRGGCWQPIPRWVVPTDFDAFAAKAANPSVALRVRDSIGICLARGSPIVAATLPPSRHSQR